MTTSYYISWMTRARNNSKRWYTSDFFETEAEARALYEKKMAQCNIREAYLWKRDHYEADELAPTYAVRHPEGYNAYDQLRAYSRI